MRVRPLGLLLFLLGVGFVLWWAFSGDREKDVPAPVLEDAYVELPDGERDDGRGEEAPRELLELADEDAASTPEDREPLAAPRLSGYVRETGGGTVGGALVRWLPVQDALVERAVSGRRLPSGKLEEASVETRTDERGSFGFAEAPDGSSPRGSVVWVAKPGYRAAFRWLPPGADGGVHDLVDLDLDAAPEHRATVLDGSGEPVPSARVEQLGLANPLHEGGRGRAADALRHLRLVFTADEHGRVSLPTLPSDELLRARHMGNVSPWRAGRSEGNATLVLRVTAEASGFVRGSPSSTGPPRVVCEAVRGTNALLLASAEVGPAGGWGPVELPVVAAESYVYRLEGGGLVPEEHRFPPPEPGQRVQVDFDGLEGVDLWFQLVDAETGEVLPDASVRVIWRENGGWRGVEARARTDGFIQVVGCRPGLVRAELRCPGYRGWTTEDIEVPLPEPATIELELEPAGLFVGRCTYRGEPVEDFEVLCVPSSYRGGRTLRFRRSADGAFRIDEAPLGELVVRAFTDDGRQSAPRSVVVSPAEPARVELELEDARRLVGRVVDGSSGEPLPRAEIVVHASLGGVGFEPIGAPWDVAADGTFEIRAAVRQAPFLEIRAPEHQTERMPTEASEEDPVDLGSIALAPIETLAVRLVGARDPTAWRVWTMEREDASPVRFPPHGEVRLDGIGAGWIRLFAEHDDGTAHVRYGAYLHEGRDWRAELPVSGECTLELEIVDGGEGVPLRDATVRTSFTTAGEAHVEAIRKLEGQRRLELSLPCTEVALSLEDGRSRTLAARSGVDVGSVHHLRLVIGEDPLAVRVVDPSGEPLSGVYARAGRPGSLGALREGISDAEGMVRFYGFPPGREVGVLLSRRGSMRPSVPVRVPEDSDEVIDLVFDPTSSLEVLLRDGDEPAVGLSCSVSDPFLEVLADTRQPSTDGRGRTSWSALHEGDYLFTAQHPDYFFHRQILHTADEPQVVQVRRWGTVELEVRTGTGAVIPGARFTLYSLEFDLDVADWAAKGTFHPPPRGMVTDTEGRLRLEGLPHGPYAWVLDLPSGETLDGTTTILPGETVEVPIAAR